MGKDFFDDLGDAFAKTARNLGERAEQMYEIQKIRNRISGEERMTEKLLADIGNLIYKRYKAGEVTDSELSVLCEEVGQHIRKMKQYKKQAAGVRGQKICPSCGKTIDKNAVFCPLCGAEYPIEDMEPETEESEDDMSIEENWEDNFPPEKQMKETGKY